MIPALAGVARRGALPLRAYRLLRLPSVQADCAVPALDVAAAGQDDGVNFVLGDVATCCEFCAVIFKKGDTNEIETALVSCFEKVVHFVYSAALLMAQL